MSIATRLARIFIYLNLGLSIVFAAWALGVFTQRIDFGKDAAKGDQPAGELYKRNEQLTKLKDARTRAEANWEQALLKLRQSEKQLVTYRVAYAKELQDLETGNQPVRFIEASPRNPESTAMPTLKPFLDKNGQPVMPLQILQKRFLTVHDEIEAEQQVLNRLIKEEEALTKELNGDGAKRGLRGQLALERQAIQNARDEQEYLEPLLYNRRVEAALLLKRQKILNARLAELQSVGMELKQP